MKSKISKIIIDYNKNNWFILTKKHNKYCGTPILGIRKILDSENKEEGMKIILEHILQTIEHIEKNDNKQN